MSKSQKRSAPSKEIAQTETAPKSADLPSNQEFTDSAFQDLRAKIEGNLKKSETKSRANEDKSRTKKQSDRQQPTKNGHGKKRSHDGEIKLQGNQSQNQPTKKARRGSTGEKVEDAVDLKTLVAELGGTEEDIDLINGAESDSELEGFESQKTIDRSPELKKGKTLESGMANILKEIALVQDTYKISESDDEVQPIVNGTTSPADTRAGNEEDDSMKFKSAAAQLQNQHGKKMKLRRSPRPDWFSDIADTIDTEFEPRFEIPTKSIDQLHAYGKTLLQAENEAFKATQASSSSQSFYNTVIASGTLSDKISALTLAVQESPLHNVRALEHLIGLAKKRSRSQAVDVLRALKDLFALGSLLPSDRKLYTFANHPILTTALSQTRSWQSGDPLPNGVDEALLIVLTFEDWLKEQYFEILKVLETWCNDEIDFAKAKATSYVYELLKEKPEQEANLLRLLINKLGDPVKKIASQASYLIMQLLANHPAMKDVVVSAIESDFIFKPGQTIHAKYYAAITLNQTSLGANEENIALKLLNIYFGLFKTLLKSGEESKATKVKHPSSHRRQREQAASTSNTEQEEELREKLTSAVLTGVNRAYPYAGADHQHFNEHVDTLFKITHSANFNTSIQALMLIQQLTASNSLSSDRFYRVLYESLLDARIVTSSKQQLYLNLLHRSLKADLDQKRVKAFAKRIIQVLSVQDPSFICGAFFLLQDLGKTFPSLATMLDQPEDNDEEEEVFRDVEPSSDGNNMMTVDTSIMPQNSKIYDPSKRDPSHAHADTSCLWDVLPFLAHYHPSVNVSADHIIDHKTLPGKPDLTLHTLIHFLDRFVYKNAKISTSTKMRGSSIMQPMANEDTRSVLVGSAARTIDLPVNSAEFLAKKDSDVAAEDVFFHQYFKTIGRSGAKKIKKKAQKEDDEGENEDEVWQAMLNNAPDLEEMGLDDEDDFSDMEGFEQAMDDVDDDDNNDEDEQGHGDPGLIIDDEDDDSVDIEAGIFEDSEEEDTVKAGATQSDDSDEEDSDFGGLSSDDEKSKHQAPPSKKTIQKREDRERKKKLRSLPMFASVADYAKELEDDEDEDLG